MLILPNRRAFYLVLGLLGVSALTSGCAPQKPAVVEAARFDASLPLDEVMGHVIDPAAFGYWKGSGTEETEAGTKDLSPTTPEGWEALENSAAVLMGRCDDALSARHAQEGRESAWQMAEGLT